jgi:acyl carrier protein
MSKLKINRDEIEKKLMKIVTDEFPIMETGVENITAQKPFADYIKFFDSFNQTVLAMAVEKTFNVDIPEAEVVRMSTIRDISTWLEKNL